MSASHPVAPLRALDTVWFQVSGTLCNLRCTHCFISCSPVNASHEMMSLAQVRSHLEAARRLGVREYYFTGGEPFLNPDLLEMIEAALAQGPVTVLTNGTLISRKIVDRLRSLAMASEHSLDLRVSLDGPTARSNDAIRGEGTFERGVEALRRLAEAGLTPIVTVTQADASAATSAGRRRWLELLREIGLRHPRLKVMPLLRMGAETDRSRGYDVSESLAGFRLSDADLDRLACATGRMITTRGVYVCPIRIEDPDARVGERLEEAMRPAALDAPACHTCHVEGLSCLT